MRILISGALGGSNVGDSFFQAAREDRHEVEIIDLKDSVTGPSWWKAINWHLFGKRPSARYNYNRSIRLAMLARPPDFFLTTGISPVNRSTLALANRKGTLSANFSTDDPWNPRQRYRGFLATIPSYDMIFTPRRKNHSDFVACGARRTEYLPFAYDPRFVNSKATPNVPADVLFVGGADMERAEFLSGIIGNGVKLRVIGSYWDRFPNFAQANVGHAAPQAVCDETAAAKINVCLVRRANRDHHVMRTFEIAAIGGFMLAEDTADHREILGDSAIFFTSREELAARANELLKDPEQRTRLAISLKSKVLAANHTYKDRLRTMIAEIFDRLPSQNAEKYSKFSN